MYTTTGRDYSALEEFVTAYRKASRRMFSGGKAKRDRMVHDARVRGECEGLATGFQVFLTQHRIAAFPKLTEVLISPREECEEFLDRAIHLLDEAAGQDLDSVFEVISREFAELIRDEWTQAREDERREQAIISGNEQPTEEDRAWLAEKARAAREEADRLARALGQPVS